MGIFGIAKRGFGMLKKARRIKKRKKMGLPGESMEKMTELRKKIAGIDKDFKKASERALKFSKKMEK
jgi:hypothetical protein